jgi:hypothetical protein
VAYNTQHREYLVVWEEGVVNTNAQRVSGSGNLIGGSFSICNAHRQQYYPLVAYNPHANEYLVVWDDFRNNMHHDIYGRRVLAYGSPRGPDITICMLEGDQRKPDVGFCLVTNEYLVAWPDYRPSVLYPDLYCPRVSEAGLVGSMMALSTAH